MCTVLYSTVHTNITHQIYDEIPIYIEWKYLLSVISSILIIPFDQRARINFPFIWMDWYTIFSALSIYLLILKRFAALSRNTPHSAQRHFLFSLNYAYRAYFRCYFILIWMRECRQRIGWKIFGLFCIFISWISGIAFELMGWIWKKSKAKWKQKWYNELFFFFSKNAKNIQRKKDLTQFLWKIFQFPCHWWFHQHQAIHMCNNVNWPRISIAWKLHVCVQRIFWACQLQSRIFLWLNSELAQHRTCLKLKCKFMK